MGGGFLTFETSVSLAMENVADLVTEGDTVAVVAADENDDYFLLQVHCM